MEDRTAAATPELAELIEKATQPPDKVSAPCTVTWCVLGQTHPYDSWALNAGAELTRFHESENLADEAAPSVVIITAYETKYGDEAPTIETPKISVLERPAETELTAAGARDLAAGLVRAAAKLDEIDGAR